MLQKVMLQKVMGPSSRFVVSAIALAPTPILN
jgi:hypothetical protein